MTRPGADSASLPARLRGATRLLASRGIRGLRLLAGPVRTGLSAVLCRIGPAGHRHKHRARHAASRGNWTRAAGEWEAAIGTAHTPRPSWYHHLSVAREVSGDLDAALVAQEAAVDWADGRVDLRARLGLLYERTGDRDSAIEVYRVLIDEFVDPGPDVFVSCSRALRAAGRHPEADEVAESGLVHHPRSGALRAAHARVATDRRAWAEAAHRWRIAINSAGLRPPPRWLFELGKALEMSGRFEPAAATYAEALEALGRIDESWAHEAELEWSFRRRYCVARTDPLGRQHEDQDALTSLTLEGVEASGETPRTGRDTRPGWFAVEPAHFGLRLLGKVQDDRVDTVEVCLDDTPLRALRLDPSATGTTFRFTLRTHVLRTLPASSSISVRSKEGTLTTPAGTTDVRVLTPGGDGSIFDRLRAGAVLTKKGTLVEDQWADAEVADRQLLRAYARLREVLKEECGIDAFLMYGSLLGCHRDGRFIPDDDDLDVGYLTAAIEPEALKRQTISVVRALARAGLDVGTRHGGGLFKVWIEDAELDVYPVWFTGGRAWAYDAIAADPSDYGPPRTATLRGVEVLIPRNPEHVLEGTYGPGWRRHDPGFRHYRGTDVTTVLDRTYLTRRELRDLKGAIDLERASRPETGRFFPHNTREAWRERTDTGSEHR